MTQAKMIDQLIQSYPSHYSPKEIRSLLWAEHAIILEVDKIENIRKTKKYKTLQEFLLINKTCHCGRNYCFIPDGAGYYEDEGRVVGISWNCTNPNCRHTLTLSEKCITEAIKNLASYVIQD